MHLIICVACGHSVFEHLDSGCNELLEMDDDGYPEACTCEKTAAEVVRQVVPPLPGVADGER